MRNTVVEKSRRRLLILSISTMLLSVMGGTLFAIHQWQSTLQYRLMRQHATEAMQSGNYEQAVEQLSHCLAYWPDDKQLLEDYAKAQMHVGDQVERYVELTIDVLNRSLVANPFNDDTARLLADLYLNRGDEAQAITVADRVLEQQPQNLPMLKRRAMALARQGQFEQAMADVDQCINLSHDDHDLYLLRLYLMKQLQLPHEQFLATVENWQPTLSNLAWSDLLMGMACRLIGLDTQALHWFNEAAGHVQDDTHLVYLLVLQFEAMGQYQQASDLLERTDPKQDAVLLYQKAWRYWQKQDDAHLLDMKHEDVPEVLTLQILALKRTHQTDLIAHKRQLLRTSSYTNRSVACVNLLTLLLSPTMQPAVEIIDAAMFFERHSHMNDLADVVLAQQWERLAEADRAMDIWRRLSLSSPGWSMPHLQQARLLLAMGHPLAAAASARAVLTCDPADTSAGVLLVEALSQVGTPRTQQMALKLFEDMTDKLPADTHVLLAARLLEPQKVEAQINEAVSNALTFKPQTWLELARIANQRKAVWHDVCLAQFKRQTGTTPQWLSLKAQAMVEAHKPVAARELVVRQVNEQVQQHTDQAADWLLVQAKFLMSISDYLAAHLAYQHLLNTYSNNLAVAQAILDEPVKLIQPELRQQAIDRLHQLTSDHAVRWRYEQAQLNLSLSMDNASLAQSAQLLHEVLKRTPSAIPSRLLLIQCLEQIGSTQGIVEQVQAILQVDPYNPTALALQQQAQR